MAKIDDLKRDLGNYLHQFKIQVTKELRDKIASTKAEIEAIEKENQDG